MGSTYEMYRIPLDKVDRTNADSVQCDLLKLTDPDTILAEMTPGNGYSRDYPGDGYKVLSSSAINFTVETDGIQFKTQAGEYQCLVFRVELVPVH